MKLKRMADDLEKFHSSDALTLEDVLGILQNVSRDIKKETGQSVEECTVRDADAADRSFDLDGEALSANLCFP